MIEMVLWILFVCAGSFMVLGIYGCWLGENRERELYEDYDPHIIETSRGRADGSSGGP